MEQRGGIGSGLDSKTKKGTRKEKQERGPGRPAKRQASAAELKKQQLAAARQLRLDRKEKAETDSR